MDKAKLDAATKLLGIRRISGHLVAGRIREKDPKIAAIAATIGDREMWFGPKGEVIGLFSPADGLAALKRCVAIIDFERRVLH